MCGCLAGAGQRSREKQFCPSRSRQGVGDPALPGARGWGRSCPSGSRRGVGDGAAEPPKTLQTHQQACARPPRAEEVARSHLTVRRAPGPHRGDGWEQGEAEGRDPRGQASCNGNNRQNTFRVRFEEMRGENGTGRARGRRRVISHGGEPVHRAEGQTVRVESQGDIRSGPCGAAEGGLGRNSLTLT